MCVAAARADSTTRSTRKSSATSVSSAALAERPRQVARTANMMSCGREGLQESRRASSAFRTIARGTACSQRSHAADPAARHRGPVMRDRCSPDGKRLAQINRDGLGCRRTNRTRQPVASTKRLVTVLCGATRPLDDCECIGRRIAQGGDACDTPMPRGREDRQPRWAPRGRGRSEPDGRQHSALSPPRFNSWGARDLL